MPGLRHCNPESLPSLVVPRALRVPRNPKMSITREDVEHVAKLAHLELNEAEVDRLTTDLARIVAYVAELAEIDTTGVAPTNSVSVDVAPLRADERRAGLSHEAALKEAPRISAGGFAVPTFVEEG